MRLLVTGGTGFLGQHIIEDLKDKYEEIIFIGRNEDIGNKLNKDNVRFVKADMADLDSLDAPLFDNIDVVIHSAAMSSPWGNHDDFYQNNVIATKNLLYLCKDYNIKRFIHISTPSIYFNGEDKENIKEDSKLPDNFVNAYASTKREAEILVSRYLTQYKIPFIILRPRGIFGERDTSIIPRILQLADKGKVPLIDFGKAKIDMTYVKNVVHAIDLSINAKGDVCNEFYNITNNEPMTVKSLMDLLFSLVNKDIRYKNISYKKLLFISSLLEKIAKITGKEPLLTKYSVGLIAKTQTLSIDKAKEKLGYSPIYTIKEGIQRYSEWKKQQ